ILTGVARPLADAGSQDFIHGRVTTLACSAFAAPLNGAGPTDGPPGRSGATLPSAPRRAFPPGFAWPGPAHGSVHRLKSRGSIHSVPATGTFVPCCCVTAGRKSRFHSFAIVLRVPWCGESLHRH